LVQPTIHAMSVRSLARVPNMSPTYFLAAIVVAGCGDPKPRARHTPPAVSDVQLTGAAPTVPRAEALYVYSPAGKRDPFRSYSRPRGDDGGLTPLQKWATDQFNLKFTVTGTASPKAVLTAPDSRAWLVGMGDYVGNSWGKVTAIERDRVVVTESIEGPGGTLYPRAINLELPPPGNAEPEHHMIDMPPGSNHLR
ncbi:MAG: pilus assembly protein PilP, partial [Myxococcales bacterium]